MSKPSNCKCGSGGYRVRGHNWRVLTRRPRPGTCQFKCLACGWKWWARRRYADKLPDHSEQPRTGMTDQDILDRIEEGSLIVDTKRATVVSVTHHGRRQLRVLRRKPPGGTYYNFVEICKAGRKKKITLHRLVWMAAHRQLIPDDCDIDHINGKGIPNADGIDNLRLMDSMRNQTRGYVSPTPQLPYEEEVPF